MRVYNKVILTTAFLFCTFYSWAQDGLSPLSVYGVGRIKSKASVRNLGMGGLGLSNGSTVYSNMQNPALVSTNKFAMFNFAASGSVNELNLDNDNAIRKYSGSFDYFNMTFPVSPKVTLGLGIRALSKVDYNTSYENRILYSPSFVTYAYKGTGGINNLYLTPSWEISKNFRVGVDLAYNFGIVDKESSSTPLNGSNQFVLALVEKENYSGLTSELGFLYSAYTKEKTHFNFGAVFQPAMEVGSTVSSEIERRMANEVVIHRDTLKEVKNTLYMPQKLGFGISFEEDYHYTIGFDFESTSWSTFYVKADDVAQPSNLVDSYIIKFGAEWIPDANAIRGYHNRMAYRCGAFYEKLPYEPSGNPTILQGVSIGTSLPMKNYSSLNLALTAGQEKIQNVDNFEINYLKVNIGVVVNDRWFIKRKIN